MSFKISGAPINLTCTEPGFPEFPTLLFGTIEGVATYIDTTQYLKNFQGLNVLSFLKAYEAPIQALVTANNIDPDKVCVYNHEGHILIEGSLVYLFLSYTNPDFLAYIFDRMDEMFTTGFCVSDTYLLAAARRRLPAEVLTPPDE